MIAVHGTGSAPDDVYDPDVRKLVEAIRARGAGSLQDNGIEAARHSLESVVRPPGPDMRSVQTQDFTGPHGAVPVRIYRPRSAPDRHAPALVWFHGGGMIMGTLDSFDRLAREVAESTRAVVINVGYRLAPEHRYPVAHDEACAADAQSSSGGSRIASRAGSSRSTVTAITSAFLMEFVIGVAVPFPSGWKSPLDLGTSPFMTQIW